MAILINNEKDMVSHINMAVAEAQIIDYEMVVVPLAITDTIEKAAALLLDVRSFDPRIASHMLPKDAVGKVCVGKSRRIHDALDELESLTMVSVHELILAGSCAVSQHVKGKTRKVKTKMGELIVDLQQFGELSELPLNSPKRSEYSVFLRQVTDKKFGDKKIMLVLVKGSGAIYDDGGEPTALQSMIARMEARANTGLEPTASFHARELDNVWQLYNNALFVDLLGWWKRGYHHVVRADENRGLHISY